MQMEMGMECIKKAKELFSKGDLIHAINMYEKALEGTKITDYLLTHLSDTLEIDKEEYIKSWFNLGTMYKIYFEASFKNFDAQAQGVFKKSIDCFINVLKITVYHDETITQIVSLYTQVCMLVQNDYDKCLAYLEQVLVVSPCNAVIHYNLGHVYQRKNNIAKSIIHYKLAITLSDDDNLIVNSYNGISCLYRSLKSWNEARWYLEKAIDINPNDPDINNQIAVVYTELRRTDMALKHYQIAISNYASTFISDNKDSLLAEIHLNMGHMYSYNGDVMNSIECYNKSLGILPKFRLPFQNKLMNLSYIFNQLDDKMYITKQHKMINKILDKPKEKYVFDTVSGIVNIGIVSGDFVDHPVSYFISAFLKLYDTSKFTVTCYSECIIDTGLFNKNIVFKLIKNKDTKTVADLINGDKIHILIDLAGHTAFNRLDVFAFKPAPIQINYCGYPFTSGLNEMDYRITDSYCDNQEISSKFYTEKLLFVKDSFLCYSPKNDEIPDLSNVKQGYQRDGMFTIGCFNRLNKINSQVIQLIRYTLERVERCRFVFKTKAFENEEVREKFLNNFDESLHNRIKFLTCTILHDEHLLEYNGIDVSLDTFPYSGTTTSCESLLMGVPVFTKEDTVYSFHPQNVTKSILMNSDGGESGSGSGNSMEYFIYTSNDEFIEKIKKLMDGDNIYTKQYTQECFVKGKVCNKNLFVSNFQACLLSTLS
jgi:protein O-GlcNAc transferase